MSLKGHTREIVLTAALVVVLFYVFRPAGPGDLGGGASRGQQGPDAVMQLIARWDAYGGVEEFMTSEAELSVGRSLFDYGKPPPPPGPTPEELAAMEAARQARLDEERRKREEAERLRREALERQRQAALDAAKDAPERQATPPPASKPVPPSIGLKFIGLVGASENKIAIFLDGDEFLMAREGDTVKEDFQIQKIGYDSLQMGFTDPRFAEESRVMPMGK